MRDGGVEAGARVSSWTAGILPAKKLRASLSAEALAKAENPRSRTVLPFLFGFFTPIVPVFGQNILLLFAAIFLLSVRPNIKEGFFWARWYLVVVLVWSLTELCFVQAVSFPFSASISGAIRLLVLLALFQYFRSDIKAREVFTKGLMWGLVPALILGLVAAYRLPALTFANQSPLWLELGRLSATFSDPNAFGVWIVLFAPLFLKQAKELPPPARYFWYSLGVAWFTFSLFSGSRSLLLGFLFYGALYLLVYHRRHLVTVSISVLALLVLLNLIPIYTFNKIIELAPLSLERALTPLRLEMVYDALFSRVVFWRIAIEVWLDNWLSGVGYAKFSSTVPLYAKALNIATGSWSDNANSYYLSILAETGIIGLVAFLFAISHLRFNNDRYARFSVLCLLVLLVVGPHLDFDEVTVITALLLGSACTVRPKESSKYFELALTSILVIFLCFKGWFSEHGFYNWESDKEGPYRWTMSRARTKVSCVNSEAFLTFRAAHPDLGAKPVTVRILSPIGAISETLSSSEPKTVTLACPKIFGEYKHRSIIADIEVSRTWKPSAHGSSDNRSLGIQIRGMDSRG